MDKLIIKCQNEKRAGYIQIVFFILICLQPPLSLSCPLLHEYNFRIHGLMSRILSQSPEHLRLKSSAYTYQVGDLG